MIAVHDAVTGAPVAGPSFSASTATSPATLVQSSCATVSDAGSCDSWFVEIAYNQTVTVTATALGYQSGSVPVEIIDPDTCCINSPDQRVDLPLQPADHVGP